MKQFKVIEIPKSINLCENELNALAGHGWDIVGVSIYQIFLSREKPQKPDFDVVAPDFDVVTESFEPTVEFRGEGIVIREEID
jgi:hypothetical protein